MQPSKKTKTSKQPGAAAGNKGASGNAGPAKAVASTKNTKESFQKKLLLIQKNYDYKDESRDVKGKTERLNAINEI